MKKAVLQFVVHVFDDGTIVLSLPLGTQGVVLRGLARKKAVDFLRGMAEEMSKDA